MRHSFRCRRRTIDELEVAIHDLGGHGPALVLAHATGFHGLVWKPIADRLADTFHCWSFDERGHGDTSSPLMQLELRGGLRDDTGGYRDALGLDRPYGVGHSGGGAALLLAEQLRPGTFTALFGYEPVVMPMEGSSRCARERAEPLTAGSANCAEIFPSKARSGGTSPANPLIRVRSRHAVRRSRLRGTRRRHRPIEMPRRGRGSHPMKWPPSTGRGPGSPTSVAR